MLSLISTCIILIKVFFFHFLKSFCIELLAFHDHDSTSSKSHNSTMNRIPIINRIQFTKKIEFLSNLGMYLTSSNSFTQSPCSLIFTCSTPPTSILFPLVSLTFSLFFFSITSEHSFFEQI